MNNVQLIGRLTKDVELRYANSVNGQQAYARFTVAVDRAPKQDGTREADFIACIAWGRQAEMIQQHFQKGSKIGLVGRIQTGSYQNQQGATIYTTDVVVISVDFIDPKNTQPNATAPGYNMQQGQAYYQQAQPAPAPAQQAPAQQAPAPAPAQPRQKRARSQQAPAPAPVPAQQAPAEDWVNMDYVQDEGLPFN